MFYGGASRSATEWANSRVGAHSQTPAEWIHNLVRPSGHLRQEMSRIQRPAFVLGLTDYHASTTATAALAWAALLLGLKSKSNLCSAHRFETSVGGSALRDSQYAGLSRECARTS